jgi:hypothetical protein
MQVIRLDTGAGSGVYMKTSDGKACWTPIQAPTGGYAVELLPCVKSLAQEWQVHGPASSGEDTTVWFKASGRAPAAGISECPFDDTVATFRLLDIE